MVTHHKHLVVSAFVMVLAITILVTGQDTTDQHRRPDQNIPPQSDTEGQPAHTDPEDSNSEDISGSVPHHHSDSHEYDHNVNSDKSESSQSETSKSDGSQSAINAEEASQSESSINAEDDSQSFDRSKVTSQSTVNADAANEISDTKVETESLPESSSQSEKTVIEQAVDAVNDMKLDGQTVPPSGPESDESSRLAKDESQHKHSEHEEVYMRVHKVAEPESPPGGAPAKDETRGNEVESEAVEKPLPPVDHTQDSEPKRKVLPPPPPETADFNTGTFFTPDPLVKPPLADDETHDSENSVGMGKGDRNGKNDEINKNTKSQSNTGSKVYVDSETSQHFPDPVPYSTIDMSRVDQITRKKMKNYLETRVIYKADDYGYIKMDIYKQTIHPDGSIHLEMDQVEEHVPELVYAKMKSTVIDNDLNDPVSHHTESEHKSEAETEEPPVEEILTEEQQQGIIVAMVTVVVVALLYMHGGMVTNYNHL